MLEIQVGLKDDDKVLVSRIDGVLHCVSNKCSHYGAPLGKGLLVEDRVICPWHAASFSVKTGAPEYGPVLDGLEVFPIQEEVTTEGSKKATITIDLAKMNQSKTINMVKHNIHNQHTIVIVGAGPAAISCAETLR